MTPELRTLGPTELDAAAAVLGDGMRDNPLHVAAFGSDPEARERHLGRLFAAVLRRSSTLGAVEGAFESGRLVGVCARLAPDACRLSFRDKFRIFGAIRRGLPWSAIFRIMTWAGDWARRDSPEPHWHLGPVGVLRGLQGKGIGGALLRAFCAKMDAERARAYLETDKAENVKIYERFGFAVVGEAATLGVPCWFMSRPVR